MVTSLPIEGLHCILDQLPHADLKTLRLTCQSLNNIVSPRLFATLIIDIRKRSNRRIKIALLEAIASHKTSIATFVESLEIHSLTPARYKPLHIWKHLTKKRVRSYYAFERAFITCIPYLVALKSVTFNFSPMRYIQPSSEDRIMRSLSSLPELRHVSILMHHRGINPSTPHSIGRHFKNISSLYIAGDASSYYGSLPAVLISKSPMINAITVDSAWHVAISDIFCETSEPLSLKSLTVGPQSFKFFDDVSLISPHVECLSSLSIGSEATDVPKAFWQLLMDKKVAIHHLTVRRVDETLLCYLESYSGLLKLSLSPGEAAETDKNLASRFFRRALAKHAVSLKSLRVCSPQEGPWCLGEDNFSDIVACPNLSALHIFVGQQGKPTNDALNVITGLLESVQNEKLPLLKLLELEPATSRKSQDPNMNMYSPELVRGHHYINDSISKFCIVDPSHALRQLELSAGHMDTSRLVKWEENQWTFMLQTTVGGR